MLEYFWRCLLDKMVHEYFPQRYENAMEVLNVMSEMTVKVNLPKPRQTSTAKTTVKVNPPQLPTHKTRRQILILGGLAGSGLVGALLTQIVVNKRPPEKIDNVEPIPETPPENIFTPQPTPSPTPPPRPKIPIQTFTTVTVNRRGEIISRTQGQAEVMT